MLNPNVLVKEGRVAVIDNSAINLHQAVHNGALLLDREYKDWVSKITKPIDMNSAGLCMLGQLYECYHRGINSLKLTPDMVIECGFHVDTNNLNGAAALDRLHRLSRLWTQAVNKRRPADQQLALPAHIFYEEEAVS